jgi:hypothetical protein
MVSTKIDNLFFNKQKKNCQGSVVSHQKGTYVFATHHSYSLAVAAGGRREKPSSRNILLSNVRGQIRVRPLLSSHIKITESMQIFNLYPTIISILNARLCQ